MGSGYIPLSVEEKTEWLKKINEMSHLEMARMVRFAPAGHPVFDRRNGLADIFFVRFDEFGGMTPGVSKTIGW